MADDVTIDYRYKKHSNGKEITKSKYYKYFILFVLLPAAAMTLYGIYCLFNNFKYAYFLFWGLGFIFYAILYSRPEDMRAKKIKDISWVGKISAALSILCMLATVIWMFFYLPGQSRPLQTPAIVITPAMVLLVALVAAILGLYVFLMKKL